MVRQTLLYLLFPTTSSDSHYFDFEQGGGVSNISQKERQEDAEDGSIALTVSQKGRIETVITLQTTGISAECRNALEAKGIVDVISTANNSQISAILDDIMTAILIKQEFINHEKSTITTASAATMEPHHTGSRPVSPSKLRDKEAKKIKKRIMERFKYVTNKDDENGSDGKREISVHEFIDIVEQEAFHGELVRRARARFNELDTNKNGTLEGRYSRVVIVAL